MTSKKSISKTLHRLILCCGLLTFLLATSSSFAQDRKPINNKRQIRETRAKSVKRKEKASTKDIAGKRLRTRNQSSAQRAVYSATSPYRNKRGSGEKAGTPIGGGKGPRVRSRSGEAARANVYPQKGPFVNHNSKKPGGVKYDNRREVARAARLGTTHREPPGRNRRVTPRSNSQAFITRGRRNVYWGKYSKGEKAITTDVAGRPLRTKNFRTPSRGVIAAPNPYSGRKKTGDRAYSGTFRSGYKSASRRGELPWKGDISGQPIRRRPERNNQVAGVREPGKGGGSVSGQFRSNKPLKPKAPGANFSYMQKDQNKLRGIKPERGGGSVSGKYKSNEPLRARAPGISTSLMRKDQGKLKGIKPERGGGSVSGKYKSNEPLRTKVPGLSTLLMRKDQGKLKGVKPERGGGSVSGKYKSNEPLRAKAPGISTLLMRKDQGKLKGIKPIKGGGSISAQMKNGKNVPLPRRSLGNPKVAGMQANYKGTIKREDQGFSQRGLNHSGNIKSMRPQKGGGSISAQMKRNNNGQPIPVKQPLDKRAANFQGNYKGFIKRNSIPSGFSQDGLSYTGSMKARKPLKGGGSVSGSVINNKPLPAFTPNSISRKLSKYQGDIKGGRKTYSQDGYDYTGNIRQQKKTYNQDGYSYTGDIIQKKKTYNQDGYDFTGYYKAPKPFKGGGSVSGKLWNNNGKPLPPKIPTGDQAKDINYSGKTKLPLLKREYVRNPNANEKALKKHSPYENTYQVNGLMVRVKQKETSTKPKAVKGSMPGVGPTQATIKASEYTGRIKVYWDYKHNPSSAEGSLKTLKNTKSFEQATTFAGKTRLTKNYRHNPNSHKDALKGIAPGRASARIDDYQGNVKMNKYNHKKHFPDAEFAHGKENNVKGERTIMTDFKLLFTKLFKKNNMQPDAVKDKVRRPRYDKKEKELWKDLYD